MNKSDLFFVIRNAINSAPQGEKTVTVQLQIIKYHDHLVGVTAREFVESVGLKDSLVTLYTDSMKLARKLSEASMKKENI